MKGVTQFVMRTAGLFNNLGANKANMEQDSPLLPDFHIRALLANEDVA